MIIKINNRKVNRTSISQNIQDSFSSVKSSEKLRLQNQSFKKVKNNLFDNDLLIVLNGYYPFKEYDDFYLKSLESQVDKNFSVVFIDPLKSDIRKYKLEDFQRRTKIQSFYLPYERDFRSRRYDWATRNIASMLLPEGRFFNYWQNRIINNNIVKFINENKNHNIGFARIWLDPIYKFPFNEDQNIKFNTNCDAFLNSKTCCFESNIEQNNIISKHINYCFYDGCFFVDDFLNLNGTDEALTSWLYEEDWDIETRWKVAADLGLLKEVIVSSPQMMYFGRGSRKFIEYALDVSTYNSNKKYYHCKTCDDCFNNFKTIVKEINTKKNVDNLQYIGFINNYIEWFKCKICGLLWPVTGENGFEYIYKNAVENKIYKASIGIDGNYGRNLQKIRNDVLLVKSWEEKVEIINNSWKNEDYYKE